jgi:hypothetical protein
MLSIVSITSRDQGKLFPQPKTEDDYFARYLTAADRAEPAVQQTRQVGIFQGFAWGRILAKPCDRTPHVE